MNTNLIEAKQCPNCGKPLPSGALAELCPVCLLAQGTAADTREAGAPHFHPPAIADIARLFPQLEILGLLGAGGMGAVYKARQPALDRVVALKILPAANSSGVNFAERFNREARALARLSHPNIVAVHEFGQAGNLHFFLMEFVDGANLRQLARASRVCPREALQIIPQICDALQFAHDEGVVHRDIKPENVLVDRKGRVKIADFGLAKILGYDSEAARLTAEGQIMGTPHYMAPEQVERPLSVDHRADIYSLGVVFYEMLTGDLPLGKFPPPSRKVQLDVRFDDVVLRALENDPARRYQRASEVKSQVETIAGTAAPAVAPTATAQAEGENRPRPGVRYLRWAGIPVVVERDGEREVNFQGALTAVFVTMLVAAAAHMLVRWLAGTEHSMARLVWIAGVITVVWGIRRTLNQACDEEPQRAKHGTVVLAPQRRFPYLGDALMLVGLFAFVISSHYFKTLVLSRPAGGLKAALARQTAERDEHTGTLTVKLPGRGTVELLAVADVNAAPNQWWRPDGTPETDFTYELPNPVECSVSGRVSKDFLVRFTDLPNGAAYTGFSTDLASGAGSGGAVFCDGQQLPGVVQVRTAFPPEARRDNFRVALALEPWRTIGTQQGHSQSSNQERKLTDPNWQVSFHAPTRNERGEAQISYVFGPENRLWTHRLVTVDTNGVEHVANSAQGTPFEKITLWTCTFDRLPWTQVREYRVQVRPLYWVEFSNVALQPTAALPAPQSSLVFTAPSLLTLDEIVDLDIGHTANFPSDTSGANPNAGAAENVAWALAQGFDAFAGVDRLELLSVRLVPITAADWELMTPAAAEARLVGEGTSPPELRPSPDSTPAYAFRTRDGGLGLLRIVEVTDNGQKFGIQLRHSARPSDAPRLLPVKLDPKSHTLRGRLPGRGSLELLALRSGVNAAWQRPNGERADAIAPQVGSEFDASFLAKSAPGGRRWQMLLRAEHLPAAAEHLQFEYQPLPMHRGFTGGVIVPAEAHRSGIVSLQVLWPETVTNATLRVSVPMAPWHQVGSYEPLSGSRGRTSTGNDPRWNLEMHAAGLGTKGAQLTVVFGTNYPGWNLRVVATRLGHAPVVGMADVSVTNGSAITKTFVFPELKALEAVQNFQVQAQPVEWVEFADLNLPLPSSAGAAGAAPASLRRYSVGRSCEELGQPAQPHGVQVGPSCQVALTFNHPHEPAERDTPRTQ